MEPPSGYQSRIYQVKVIYLNVFVGQREHLNFRYLSEMIILGCFNNYFAFFKQSFLSNSMFSFYIGFAPVIESFER